MPKVPPLTIWRNGIAVATVTGSQPFDLRIAHTPAAAERWGANTPVVSCSLPVLRRKQHATGFLRGYLPEGPRLQAAAERHGIPTNYTSQLVLAYGLNLPGALIVTGGPPPPGPDQWSLEELTAQELTRRVQDLPAGQGEEEISLQGFQDKLALTLTSEGRWAIPLDGHPSTHMLKADSQTHRGMVRFEASALHLAAAVGLGDLEPQLQTFGDRDALIVRRYDRHVAADGIRITRTHQEDSCQALGIDHTTAGGRAKQQRHGGPSYADIAGVLRLHSADRDADLRRLAGRMVLTTLIRDEDAHGKNIAFILGDDTRIRLAPAYDTVPTELLLTRRRDATMSVTGQHDFARTSHTDLVAEARSWGLGDTARAIVNSYLEAIVQAATTCGEERVEALVRTEADRIVGHGPRQLTS